MISKSNQWLTVVIVLIILLLLFICAVGYFTNKLLLFTSISNLTVGLSIIVYWAVRQTQIKQHSNELREMIVLGAEAAITSCALYWLVTNNLVNIVRVVQYTLFGIHLCLAILALIFALTFKMNKMI
ncbi:MAG: hypothetical protein ABIN67_07755 [Ferruginibacter sp.]